MQQFYSYLNKLNHPLLVFLVLGIRSGILGASIGDALFLISYVGYVAYQKYLENQRKEDINEKIKSEIGELKNMVSAMGLKNTAKPNELPTGKRFF